MARETEAVYAIEVKSRVSRQQKLTVIAAYTPITLVLVFITLMISMMLVSETSSVMTILMIAGGASNCIIIVCLAFFVRLVTKNSSMQRGEKVGWILYMLLLSGIALPKYWNTYLNPALLR